MNAQRFTEQNLRRLGLLCALGTLLAVSAIPSNAAASEDERETGRSRKPTIVLVHGAFADASSWAEVTGRLQKKGYTVYAFANPLRSISGALAPIPSKSAAHTLRWLATQESSRS